MTILNIRPNTGAALLLRGLANHRRYFGASPELPITQQLGRHMAISLSCYHFYWGEFLTGRAGTTDADFFYLDKLHLNANDLKRGDLV